MRNSNTWLYDNTAGLNTVHIYDTYSNINEIGTNTQNSNVYDIQDYQYSFTHEWGRPEHRYNMFGNWEYFYYDEDGSKLNRLSRVTVSTNPAENLSMQYSLNGNITSKTGLGTYSYNGLQPHAVTAIDNTNSIVSTDKQEIGYTPFNKVSYIKEKLITSGGLFYEKKLYFTYGTANQRVKTEYFDTDIQKTKYFAGNYEQEIINGNTRELHYIAGSMGLAAVYVKNGTTDTMYYTHTDHLGSITEITDNTDTLLQRFAYDAWGKRSFITNNIGVNNFLFDRGYTGHEHLDQFALINMNGRLYDPVLGRMLSPDNYVQNATGTQGFNRYSYALNNPMVYTDPSGYYSGSYSSGNSYYIDGMQVSAGSFSAYMNGFYGSEYSIEGYGDVYEDLMYEMMDVERKVAFLKFQKEFANYKPWVFDFNFVSDGSALFFKPSWDDPPNNSQSSNTATVPNFVPNYNSILNQEAQSTGGDYLSSQLQPKIDLALKYEKARRIKERNRTPNELYVSEDREYNYIKPVDFSVPGINHSFYDTYRDFTYKFNNLTVNGIYVPGDAPVEFIKYNSSLTINYAGIKNYTISFQTKGGVARVTLLFNSLTTYKQILSTKLGVK